MDLAIDPGISTGWAVYDADVLVACGVCSYDKHPDWAGVQRYIIEIPEVYPRSPVNPANLITLAYGAGSYGGYLRGRGAKEVRVAPKEWSPEPKGVCHRRSWAKLAPTEQALVTNACRYLTKDDDLRDAVALGQWAISRGLWR